MKHLLREAVSTLGIVRYVAFVLHGIPWRRQPRRVNEGKREATCKHRWQCHERAQRRKGAVSCERVKWRISEALV